MATGEVSGKQLFDMLNRASNGQLKSIPSTKLKEVIEDFKNAFEAAINPKGQADL